MKYILKVWICREIHISALGLIKNSSDNCCIKNWLRVLTEANTLLSPEISCMEHSCYSILLHSDPPSTSWNHLSEGTKKTVCTVFQWAQRAQRCWIWISSRLQPPSGPLFTDHVTTAGLGSVFLTPQTSTSKFLDCSALVGPIRIISHIMKPILFPFSVYS